MPRNPITRRRFLSNTALVPFVGSAVSAQAMPTDQPAVSPTGTVSAFPLHPVAPADASGLRKSEASMVELRDGSVLLAYASHTGRSDNDRAPIVAKKLSSEGKPISEERIVVPPPEGGFNAMSPALQRLPDGRIGMLFSYRQSQKIASRRFMASSDEGKTWTKPVVVADGQYKTGCHDRFTIHSSGRLLAACHCTDDWDKHHLHVRVARSDDMGVTWRLSDNIELPYVRWLASDGEDFIHNIESGCIEPGMAERRDGSLIMTIRTAMGTQFMSESSDRGITWSTPQSMEVVSPVAPAHISRLPGRDELLLLWTSDYDARARLMGERHTIMACVSTDGGASWPHAKRKILAQNMNQSIDYPSVLYKGDEAWITLRVSTGRGVLAGQTSTHLMRVPIRWFFQA